MCLQEQGWEKNSLKNLNMPTVTRSGFNKHIWSRIIYADIS